MKNQRFHPVTDEKVEAATYGALVVRPAAIRAQLRWGVVLMAAALLTAGVASAQLPLQAVGSPFDMVGFIDTATVDVPGDVLSGGTLIVNGHTVIVPRNTILQMPANALTWQQLFSQAPPPYGPTQTGLALTDIPTPLSSYEIHVQGNRVGDTYIAGLLFISQQSLNSGQGFINFIDYANNEMRVGGIIGNPATGTRVKINDPSGRFAPAFTLDPRFTIDTDNPTVRTETAYPMCFPHTDPAIADDLLCTLQNRPTNLATGFPQTIFTMQNPGAAPGPAVGTNAWVAAPFKVGDYITFAGTLLKDGAQPSAGPLPVSGLAGTYIAAHTIIANVGIYTAAGTNPAYVATDVMLLGVGGLPIAGLAQEATVRTRFEGFTTDPSRNISLWGMDENACTGATSNRNWGSIDVDQGPPTGAVLGRWRFRPPGKVLTMPAAGVFLPPTRMMRSVLIGAYDPTNVTPPVISGNGLITGQYAAPIFDFLFPENLNVGNPPIPLNLGDFPFLVDGSFSFAGVHVPQLAPWPGVPAPVQSCAPVVASTPIANAGPAQTVTSGVVVTLNGTGSSDPNALSIAFAWTQTAGPAVTLNNAFVAQPTFTAPTVTLSTILTFSLTVTNSLGTSSAPSTVNITVNPSAPGTAPVASAGANQTVASAQVVQLNGTASHDTNTPAQTLTFAWVQTATGGLPGVTLSNAAAITPTFFAPVNTTAAPVVLTFQLTVTNTAPLSAISTVNVTVNPIVAPIANAGPNQSVTVGTLVHLNGTGSFDPNGLPLTYSWTQVGGAAIALTGPTTATPSFTAPAGQLSASFQLIVNDGFLSSLGSVVTINFVGQADVVVITVAEYRIGKQRLTVTATSSVTDGTPVLSLAGFGPNGTSLVMPFLGAGTYTIIITGVPQPASVTVNSSLGGTATSGLTKIRQ